MSEERNTGRTSIWNQALRTIKGEGTSELVEQFTQEMTLVAEGLCEDQARLRRAAEGMKGDQAQLRAELHAVEKRLDELSRRVAALESPAKRSLRSLFSGDLLGRVTLLAAIVCGTALIISVLRIFI
ncbi:MAG: hypothetical protein IJ343_02455 [Clostridia bacterium]|nr:hypothetical protein [Clostridia bacterium]